MHSHMNRRTADTGKVHDALSQPPPRPAPPRAEIPTVLLRDVTKSFGGVQALNGLSLAIPAGSITVLLGPNGAGKTTAIRTITGALPADGGLVQTFGVDPNVDGEAVRLRCGVVSAKPALYDRLPGWDNLEYAAALYGVTANVRERVRAAAARFDIEHALDQYVGGYSTGMKTRLALSRALLHDPDLLLLDEPTSGLDPESSHAVLNLIRELTNDGTTVVMCTHLLIEAEGLADQIIMLDDGINLLQGSQQELIDRLWPRTLIRLDAEDRTTLDVLQTMSGVRNYERNGTVTVELDSPSMIADVVATLTGLGVRLTMVEPHRPSLEQLYFRVRREHRERTGAPSPALVGVDA